MEGQKQPKGRFAVYVVLVPPALKV